MHQKRIVGRKNEIELLNKVLKSNDPEFIAVYGRRRVGKTYLITTFFQDKGVFFEFTGIKDADQKTQIKNFTKIINNKFSLPKSITPQADWLSALDLLREQIEKLSENQKVILFFDELPWIATAKSNFLMALDYCWNRYLSRMNNIILVVCGSAASWMIDNVVSNTGGLHGRLTQKIRLAPFTLSETRDYLLSRNVNLEKKQIIDLYMAMGGIAKYLSQVEPGKSVPQIIDQQFFTNTGYLVGEFNSLYSSLFKNHEQHINVVRTLAKATNGLSRDDLLDKAGIGSGGTATKVLRELEESGFIMRINFYSDKKSLSKFRLIDQYSLFYLKWVESIERFGLNPMMENYWLHQANTNAWIVWSGYAFENICLIHVSKIQHALGLSGVRVIPYVWYSRGTQAKVGSQVDLILDRDDHVINLCEIKYSNNEFEISKKYAETLEQRKEIFRTQTSCKKSLFTTMITTYGITDNQYAQQIVQANLTMDILF